MSWKKNIKSENEAHIWYMCPVCGTCSRFSFEFDPQVKLWKNKETKERVKKEIGIKEN